ncbi:MAG: hypothetical protein M1548_04155 [Actinobacteria bacterium]|nr:hypothetical protein [Actinomycetota bacterium]
MKNAGEGPSSAVKHLLERAVTLGAAVHYGSLTIYPLFSSKKSRLGYLLYDEAAACSLVEVGEVTPDGRVPELKVTNIADECVLLLDGEQLVGAKQNRVLNTTVLLPPKSVTVIPVSCVEQGRWSYRTAFFASSDEPLYASLRAKKAADVSRSLAEEMGFVSDQFGLWQEIKAKSCRFGVTSETEAMTDAYAGVEPRLAKYESAFSQADGQVGSIVGLAGRPFLLELLDSPLSYGKLWRKLLRSYAIDAIDEKSRKKLSKSAARDFLSTVARAPARYYPAVSLGKDIRLLSDSTVGSALVHDRTIVHLAAFSGGELCGSLVGGALLPSTRVRMQGYEMSG